MSRRLKLLMIVAAVAIAIVALTLLFLLHAAAPVASPHALRVQPDCFPVGTVLQNSRIEMDLGIFSGVGTAPMPAFVSRLPRWLKPSAESSVWWFRNAAARMHMHVRVEAPDFVEVGGTMVAEHISQGPFTIISFRLKTQNPGDLYGNLVVHLSGSVTGVTNVTVPLSVKVIGSAQPNPPSVLIVESPYVCYSTGNGHDFDPLAALNARLAARGVRVDYCGKLPASVANYNTILLGGADLAIRNKARDDKIQKFVAGGGRLILAANFFYQGTVDNANGMLANRGLLINNSEIWGPTNLPAVRDPLTIGVTNLDFFRPSPISVTDATQGRVLVPTADGLGAYVAVSRQAGRGEVIVLSQSLWWTWIRSDPAKADNFKLFENLLAPR